MSFRRPFLRASLAALQISLDCCDAAPDHVAFGPFAAKVLLVEALDELRRSFHFDRTPFFFAAFAAPSGSRIRMSPGWQPRAEHISSKTRKSIPFVCALLNL